ncbi:MAG: four helix bundle protein [Planctomycetales bacterium]|nr:four helix bundle protein [bacterium]UNM07358.1 MAG: four helix bundle protein [Planctomycetales bacterium]
MPSEVIRKLKTWQKGMALAKSIYSLTSQFPKSEQYGMTSQMRRAAVSIPANLAEGNGRSSRRDYARFVAIAFGSARELDTLLELSIELGLANREEAQSSAALLDEICRMLYRLHHNLTKEAAS